MYQNQPLAVHLGVCPQVIEATTRGDGVRHRDSRTPALPGYVFVSIQDHIDMTTPQGRLMVQLLAAFSEFERA